MNHGHVNRSVTLTVDLFGVTYRDHLTDLAGNRAWVPSQLKVTFWDDGTTAWELLSQLRLKDGRAGASFKTWTPGTMTDGGNAAVLATIWNMVHELKEIRLDVPIKPSAGDPINRVLDLEERRDMLTDRLRRTKDALEFAALQIKTMEDLQELRARRNGRRIDRPRRPI